MLEQCLSNLRTNLKGKKIKLYAKTIAKFRLKNCVNPFNNKKSVQYNGKKHCTLKKKIQVQMISFGTRV